MSCLGALLAVLVAIGLGPAALATPASRTGWTTDDFVMPGFQKRPFAGVVAHIDGDSFNPENARCVLYSVLVVDENRQLESGLIRCNNQALDNSCDDSVFVETFHSDTGVFKCFEHGSFSNGSYYRVELLRDTDTSDTFHALLFASQTSSGGLGGFGESVVVTAWAEHTGTTNCANFGTGVTGPANAHWQGFEKYKYSTGWGVPTSLSDLDNNGPCWDISTVSGVGDWHANH